MFSALAALFVSAQAQQNGTTKGKATSGKKQVGKTLPPVTPGEPLTMELVLQMLGRVKAGTMAEARVAAFIDARGIGFTATPENLAALGSAGASEELLKKIASVGPAVPPAPPPPVAPVTGTLQLKCEPVECNIRVDGGPDKATKNGMLEMSGLRFAEYTVDFRKEGYFPQSKRVAVTAASQPLIAVVLEIAPETRTRWGAEMYKNCLKAVGGADGLAGIKNMSGVGAASSWDAAGVLSEWTIKTVISGSNYTYELANALSGAVAITCQGEVCGQKNSKGKKKLSAVEAASLNTNLVQYNRYHLLAMLERISGENHVLTAPAAPAADLAEQHLIVDSRDETYDLTLDGAFLPSSVGYKSKDGLASVKITYAQYAAFEKGAKYPKHTSISLPGSQSSEKQHGIQVRYDTLISK